MEIRDATAMSGRGEEFGNGARLTQLHPDVMSAQAVVAVDLWEIEPGGSTPLLASAEEQILFVLSGTGELSGATEGGVTATVRPFSVVHIGHREVHSLRNTGQETLRVLVTTPLLVRSERALGHGPKYRTADAQQEPGLYAPVAAEMPLAGVAENPPPGEPLPARLESGEEVRLVPEGGASEEEQPPPDISGLVKRASDVASAPRAERRKPARTPEPEPEPQQEVAPEPEAEEEAAGSLMELTVVFDGGSRGNPGEGYGSFMVQSPNRRPVIKRLEFGDNYTNNQAEYDSLIQCLIYIIERLEATDRSPAQMQLDIKGDSDLVVNQLLGTYKVKDAALRQRHKQALELLDRFAAWLITWHPRDESVRLLGH
jgi:ribonuclease HI